MLTPNVRDRLLTAELSAAEWRMWCYLVSLDPFGDRGAKFIPAELMLACSIGKSTYFATKAKFQKLGLFDFKEGETRVFNLQCQSGIPELESGIPESESKIPESESGIPECQSQKPLRGKGSTRLQTIHNIQTLQTVGEEDLNFPAGGLANPSIEREISPSNIPQDLIDQLAELEIPIDKKIREAIGSHDLSQAWGAVRHIEATAETIRSKYAVFLHQIGKQPIEKPVKGLSKEFLDWYQYARGEVVEDIAPELLPLDRYREPLVRQRSRPNELIDWRRVRDGGDLQPCTGEALRSMLDRFPGLKGKLGREEPAPPPAAPAAEPPKPPEEAERPAIDEALKAEIEKALENNPKIKRKLEEWQEPAHNSEQEGDKQC